MTLEQYINQLECKQSKQELLSEDFYRTLGLIAKQEAVIREDLWEEQTQKITPPSEMIPFLM